MHLLQGLLALLLLPGVCSAAKDGFIPFYGVWTGTITTEPAGCVWEVKARFSPRGSSVSASFTYSGDCVKGVKEGYFNADRIQDWDEDDCLKAAVALPGLLEEHGQACLESKGELLVDFGKISGRLSLEKGDKSGYLSLDLPKGSAAGSFDKVLPKKKSKGAKKSSKASLIPAAPKVKNNEKPKNSDAPAIFIGRN